MASATNSSISKKAVKGFVGFSSFPDQHHKRSIQSGFNFTVMVVGQSGLGKTTLINTLFSSSLYPEKKVGITTELQKTLDIQQVSAELKESGVTLNLTVIDTPGFGDFINNEDSWRLILQTIETRFEDYLEQNSRIQREKVVDNRIHACLYFIPPTGHSLRQLDIEIMRKLAPRVNLIPVIAKSDIFTDLELKAFKTRIQEDLRYHGINIYDPPKGTGEDEDVRMEFMDIANRMPFAIVGSQQEIKVEGRQVRGRQYPWGHVEVDQPSHCDFIALRHMLIRTHMEELKKHTNSILYELYRTQKLKAMGREQEPLSKEMNPMISLEEARAQHEQRLAKMDHDMKVVFQQKVMEKETKLKQSEDELYLRHKEMREQLERQRVELEDKRRKLELLISQQSNKPGTPEKSRKKGYFK